MGTCSLALTPSSLSDSADNSGSHLGGPTRLELDDKWWSVLVLDDKLWTVRGPFATFDGQVGARPSQLSAWLHRSRAVCNFPDNSLIPGRPLLTDQTGDAGFPACNFKVRRNSPHELGPCGRRYQAREIPSWLCPLASYTGYQGDRPRARARKDAGRAPRDAVSAR